MAEDETPEEAVVRELEEECCVHGEVIQRINTLQLKDGEQSITFLIDIGKQEPELGHEPEFELDNQPLIDLKWLSLEEIPERDRVFLWASGLLVVGPFADEVQDWGDDISYPGKLD